MAVRRKSVCLFCQVRQSSIGRRRFIANARRNLQTVALQQYEEDEFAFDDARAGGRGVGKDAVEIQPLSGQDGSEKSEVQTEEMRIAMEDFATLYKQKDSRLEVLRNLSNPFKEWYGKKDHNLNFEARNSKMVLPEANAAHIPHDVFRSNLKQSVDYGFKATRLVLRAQLLRCQTPKDIFKVVAVAMQSPNTAKNIAALTEPIVRALFRCRSSVSDPEVLRTLNSITRRFDLAGLRYHTDLLYVGSNSPQERVV